MVKDPTKDPEFKRVLGNLLKTQPTPSRANSSRQQEEHKPSQRKQRPAAKTSSALREGAPEDSLPVSTSWLGGHISRISEGRLEV
jgi:hypothetical protein